MCKAIIHRCKAIDPKSSAAKTATTRPVLSLSVAASRIITTGMAQRTLTKSVAVRSPDGCGSRTKNCANGIGAIGTRAEGAAENVESTLALPLIGRQFSFTPLFLRQSSAEPRHYEQVQDEHKYNGHAPAVEQFQQFNRQIKSAT